MAAGRRPRRFRFCGFEPETDWGPEGIRRRPSEGVPAGILPDPSHLTAFDFDFDLRETPLSVPLAEQVAADADEDKHPDHRDKELRPRRPQVGVVMVRQRRG